MSGDGGGGGDDVSSCLRLVTSCLSASGPSAVSSYMALLRSWFKMSLSRQEFDDEARALLPPAAVPLHNTFLLAILDRVYGLAHHRDPHCQRRRPRTRLADEDADADADADAGNSEAAVRRERRSVHSAPLLAELLPSPGVGPGGGGEAREEPRAGDQAGGGAAAKRDCKWSTTEVFLPDRPLVTGRLLVAAWEAGLDGADDSAAELIVTAVQVFLKNVLSVVLSQRRAYRVRDKNFVHSIGCEVPNPWLRNAPNPMRDEIEDAKFNEDDEERLNPLPTVDDMECATAYDIACGVPKRPLPDRRVSLHDVYDALKIHRNVIASHSVYAVNMERIATLLNHPGY